jgi:HPt (histidine-containing phosphotransfer) domain-containing protein
LTANAIVGNEEMFLAHGFQAFLSKPIDIMAMDVVIRQWVRNKELEQEQDAGAAELDRRREERRCCFDRRSGFDLSQTNHLVTPAVVIPGIDIAQGLKRFGGDLNVYWNVVKSFARNTPPLLDTIRSDAFFAAEIQDYAIIVHGIQSSSRSIGAEDLGTKAEALEHAAKAGDLDFVGSNHGSFIKAADQLLAEINSEISRAEEGNPKPRKTEPEEEILEDLVQACREFDIDGVDRAMEELESCDYETGSELIVWLREKVDGMGLKEIAGRLS